MKIHCLFDELIDPTRLKFHPKNRNKHPEDQIERLAKILAYQGWRYAIKISKQSGFITSGHGRVAAAIMNHWNEVPVVYQDYESTDQEYADVQADNSIASWAELDLKSINLDVPELGPDFDIDLLGIKDFTIDAADKYQEGEDDVPDQAPAIAKLGDIFCLGNHRLLCGDAINVDSVALLMNGEKADMVYTDPPYGMAYKSNGWDSKKKDVQAKRTDRVIEGDETPDIGIKAISLIPNFFSNEGHVFIWCRWDSFEVFRRAAESFSKVKGNIVWDKGDAPGLGDLECSFGGNEMAVHSIIGRRKIANRINSVWRVNRPKGITMVHPTQKPVEIIEPAIHNCSSKDDLILDLFGGSGSTLIACEKTNRRCFMMEIDPHYCDVIIARWEKFTGQKAIKVEDQITMQELSTDAKMGKGSVGKPGRKNKAASRG